MTVPPAAHFDPRMFFTARVGGHGHHLGVGYRDHGADWAELELPCDPRMTGDPASGAVATGAILTLMDMALAVAVWLKRGSFSPQATLDLRVDRLRPALPGQRIIGRGECYRVTPTLAFVRGVAHVGDPADPLAHVAGTFMLIGN